MASLYDLGMTELMDAVSEYGNKTVSSGSIENYVDMDRLVETALPLPLATLVEELDGIKGDHAD
jgi:hypothetical protein